MLKDVILCVEDEKYVLSSLKAELKDAFGKEYLIECAENGEEALEIIEEITEENREMPVVISDYIMPGMKGDELLAEVHKLLPRTRKVMLTGQADAEAVGKVVNNAGLYRYITKPWDVNDLVITVKNAITSFKRDKTIERQHKEIIAMNKKLEQKVQDQSEEIIASSQKLEQFKSAYAEVTGIGQIGVFSDKMRSIIKMTTFLHEDRGIPVLIEGETGTGKEIIARVVHHGEENTSRPFVILNCSAISPTLFESELFGYEEGAFTGARQSGMVGKLEMAQGGTLFLDEIGELPLELQPKLLRVLQQKELYRVGGRKRIELDVRIIGATNRDLQKEIEKGTFRRDLYYRLNTGRIFIPPLRERKEEIGPMSQMFLLKFAKDKGRKFTHISKEALKMMEKYHWPGNIRELQNALERIVLLYDDDAIYPDHLNFLEAEIPMEGNDRPRKLVIDFPEDSYHYDDIEHKVFEHVLRMFNGNRSHAATYLNVSRNRILRKLK
jgi:DNA-binding NtrC family response regulator